MPPASASEPPGGPPRLLCREETARRIEASLYTGIVAKLPEGTCVELVSLQGLRVELHVSPVDDPALRELIRERLRKLVCADLEIAFWN